MQAATAPHEQNDIATTVLATMRQLGVLGLPRNYEIFYEALTGSNEALSRDVVALSSRPTQDDLDAIGRRHFSQRHGHSVVENARQMIARELEDIAAILRAEHTHIEKYGKILTETSTGLGNTAILSRELLNKIAGAMSVATASTIDHGRRTVSTLSDKSAELETVKSKLEEYKLLADTDQLTQLRNRRAFDNELAAIYNSSAGVVFKALILADVDRFKDINDRFGHPVGDRILQTIATLLRSSTRGDVFVARTGGEEFALVVEGSGEEGVFAIADRLRTLLAQTCFRGEDGRNYGEVTMSMGICMASEAQGPQDLYAKADKALYRAKLEGRNRVVTHASLAERQGKNWLIYSTE